MTLGLDSVETVAPPPKMPGRKREHIRFIEEPMYWARVFGGEHFDPWSGQEKFWHEYGKILNAKLKRYKRAPMTEAEKRDARKFGVSIMAGQGLGKGATLTLAAYHYFFVLQSLRPKIVCTAPAGPQLFSSLWPEFGAWLARSPLLAQCFEKNAHRIYLRDDESRGSVAKIEPRTVQPNASAEDQKVMLAGVHALGVLAIIDEASGVPEPIMEPLEGGMTDPLSMIFMIFNPTKRTGFAVESHRKNREHWSCLHWSGEDLAAEKREHPGRFAWFNEEAQATLAKKYGRDSDFYRVRVLGLPPNQSSDTLISFESVMEATERVVEVLPTDPMVVAVDVGGARPGADPSMVMILRGPLLLEVHEYREKPQDQIAAFVADHVGTHVTGMPVGGQIAVGVDTIGIGDGVYTFLQSVHKMPSLYSINVTERPIDQRKFHRLRDQIFWELREAFMDTREISIRLLSKGNVVVDDELVGELSSIRWAEVDGKIKVQGKGSSSGIPNVPPIGESPNKADCLAMAWYLYKHCCSRLPASLRKQRRARQIVRTSWKAL